ncbi:amino acid permease-associated region [Beutenbergia cavernae DSM 12333]|uniref:Amino acid permease-associated region n=1 Tax=Beutenbergia cavernae (strain ATCC BAA-8 / DSM 12333 / CCUG 43141 / JCM 11478 / NBRC 16432 / NCIMB 13614 / HKI 0122) TaxID=471853 RepID=C5BXE2_BEUC1|nr:amino acid permease [Beutenbergia cavernae]ACQ80825.1 amino acid permease-associated region [Beutenbergia cavernae DSM 12333]
MSSAARPAPVRRTGLGPAQATALYVGAVLGTGVIGLPALAADAAGPASLVAWLFLVVASVPLAATFAALGARYPDSGGVSTYARRAFGDRAADLVGWTFWAAIPPGAPAAALFAGAYVEAAVGGGTRTVVLTGAAVLVAAFAVNWAGVRVAGWVQLALAATLVVFLLVAVLGSLDAADPAGFVPFAPHGWTAIVPAAALLVWSFVGWEAITHLTGEFRDPGRDVPRATAAALVVVGVIYLAVAFAVVAVLGARAGEDAAPLAELFAVALGAHGRAVAAVVAVLLTFGVLNAYVAGAAKLGAALARDGALPAWLARGSRAGEVPRRSLVVITVASGAMLALSVTLELDLATLVRLATACFVVVYGVGVLAALRLLPVRGAGWWAAVTSLVVVVALLVASGAYLAWPAAIAASAWGVTVLARRWRAATAP